MVSTSSTVVGFMLMPRRLAAMAKASRLLLNIRMEFSYRSSHMASQLVGVSSTMVLLYTRPTTPQV